MVKTPKVKRTSAPSFYVSGQDDPSKTEKPAGERKNGPRNLQSGAAADEQMALLLTIMTGKILTSVANSSDSSVSHSWETVVSRVGAGVLDAPFGIESSSYLSCSTNAKSFLTGDLHRRHRRLRHMPKEKLKMTHFYEHVNGFHLTGNKNASCYFDTCA